jgi:hypothetical protein
MNKKPHLKNPTPMHDLSEKPLQYLNELYLDSHNSFDKGQLLCPNVNVQSRKGPCKHHPFIKVVKPDEKVTSTGNLEEGCGKVWIEIKEGGWIATDYLRTCSTPERLCAIETVSIYKGPCTDRTVATTLHAGATVQPTGAELNGCGQEWLGLIGDLWAPKKSFEKCHQTVYLDTSLEGDTKKRDNQQCSLLNAHGQ